MDTTNCVLRRPIYSEAVGLTEGEWIAQNDELLRSWYLETSDHTPESNCVDFSEFCKVQYDLQRDTDDELRVIFDEWARSDDAYERHVGEELNQL